MSDPTMGAMSRTTFRLDADLLAEAKALAARQHRTLNSVMEDALRRVIAESAAQPDRRPFKLHTHRGPARGLKPGVNIDDNAELLDLMEARRPVLGSGGSSSRAGTARRR
jgi:hypothetical protein